MKDRILIKAAVLILFISFMPLGRSGVNYSMAHNGINHETGDETMPPISSAGQLDPSGLEKFVDALPMPSVAQPKKSAGLFSIFWDKYYEITLSEFKQKLHRDLPETTLWGYNGTYPGPTIETVENETITVKWINNLPSSHFLPIDHTIHGAMMDTPDVRVVTHLHGGHVPPESDGFPEDWFTPGNSDTDIYPNKQNSATLWYHDHALGITRLNVYAGLAGFYLIRDKFEKFMDLPAGKYEVPLVIQDRSFNEDGSLFYPSESEIPDVHPAWNPEFFGDVALVNGKVWPYFEVEARRYRFRVLNGSNSRFYNLRLTSGQDFYQIGSDGGFLERTVKLNSLLLAPGERADIIVDFTGHAGESIILTNDAPSPFTGNMVMGDAPEIPQIMQFKVKDATSEDKGEIPDRIGRIRRLSEQDADVIRDLTLEESLNEDGDPLELLLNGKHWHEEVTENPKLGDTEVWRLINLTGDTHPIHLHLVQFQVLGRQPFDSDKYLADQQNGILQPLEFYITGPAVAPDANEMGWKDTVRANPGEITRIITRFADYAGKYVWHCHILEHEDNDMMRPMEVLDN